MHFVTAALKLKPQRNDNKRISLILYDPDKLQKTDKILNYKIHQRIH